MDKKPLIGGSILAVVLLVMGSLSTVVGYQPVISTVNDSPLFQTRTQRAINQQQYIFVPQYLGLGKENVIQFPTKDNQVESVKKMIDYLRRMDDKTYEKFIDVCIQKLQQDDALNRMNVNDIVRALYQVRVKPELLKNTGLYRENFVFISSPVPNIISCDWFPGCFILIIFIDIFYYIYCQRSARCQSIFEPCN